jgi:prephenate dehydrogenase
MWDSAAMRVAVIGLGLIGGSALRALASRGVQVYGFDADPATRATARTDAAQSPPGARWEITASIADAVRGADLTIVAVPLPAVATVFDELRAQGHVGIVTDVTSVKGPVRQLAADRLRADGQALASFVGGHPMAGREKSGFTSGDAALFDGCAWVLCLEPDTVLADWLDVAALLSTLGARVVPTTAEAHDTAVATISHVPHLLAAALAARMTSDPLAATLAAGSFRDGTRVAASRPPHVAAMCGGNALAVRAALDAVLADLAAVPAILDGAEPVAGLIPWLTPGHTARSAWPPKAGTGIELPAEPEVLLRLGTGGGWITEVAADRRTVIAVQPVDRWGRGGHDAERSEVA